MKKLFFLFMLFSSFSFLHVHAFQVSDSWDFQNGKLFVNKQINDDFYAAWWDISIDSEIAWDLIVAWWNIIVDWTISQDIMIAWWYITINSNIWDDLRVLWGNVTINSNIWDDLFMAWWSLTTKSWSKINGDVTVSAWSITLNSDINWDVSLNGPLVTIDGIINWNVILHSDDIVFGSGTKILWNLEYHAKKEISNIDRYVIWDVNYVYIKKYTWDDISHIYDGLFMYKSAFLILFWMFIYFVFSKWIRNIIYDIKWNYFSTFFKWLLVYAIVPLVVILLFSTVVWIPIWIILLFAYISLLLILTKLIVLVCLVWYFRMTLMGARSDKIILLFEISSIVVWSLLLTILPYMISLLLWFFVVWSMWNRYYKLFKKEVL